MALHGPLVLPEELADHLGDPGVVVADMRWYLDGRSGRDAYEAGHLPGAVFVDLDTVLAAAPETGGGRHPLPDPGVFAGALGRIGISEDVLVVAYDDAGGAIAARLWWMLRALGQRAAVLDGGIASWTGPLERFEGKVEPVDARAGHIPGARNAPAGGNLDPQTGRFRPAEELRVRYAGIAGEPLPPVIACCGSGVTACHTLLALEVAGLPGGRLYPGSWSEWSARTDRPIATGSVSD